MYQYCNIHISADGVSCALNLRQQERKRRLGGEQAQQLHLREWRCCWPLNSYQYPADLKALSALALGAVGSPLVA
jgi:hypothetical protein